MKAALIDAHGELDRIKIEDVTPPQPASGEVLLRVRSAGLNHLDIWVRKGRKGVALPMPHILAWFNFGWHPHPLGMGMVAPLCEFYHPQAALEAATQD